MAQSLRALKLAALGESLRTCPIFAGLSRETLLAIAGITVLRSVNSGEFLFRRGDAAVELNLVLVGVVTVRRGNPPAGALDSEPVRFGRGELIEDPWVSNDQEFLCDAVAEEASQILRVDRLEFEKLLEDEPSMALGMIRSLNQRSRFLGARSGEWAVQNAEIRILHWLVRQRPASRSNKGYSVEIVGSKRRLAGELQVDLFALTSGLKRLCEETWLEVQGLTITVRDSNAPEMHLRQKLGG